MKVELKFKLQLTTTPEKDVVKNEWELNRPEPLGSAGERRINESSFQKAAPIASSPHGERIRLPSQLEESPVPSNSECDYSDCK